MRAFLIAALGAAILAIPAQAQETPTFQFSFDPTPSLNSTNGVCVQSPNGSNPYCIAAGNSSGPGGSEGGGGGGSSKGGCGRGSPS